MDVTNKINGEIEKISHPQLIVLQEPVYKILRNHSQNPSNFPEDEPEVELDAESKLDESQDPLMLSDDEYSGNLDNLKNVEKPSCSDEDGELSVFSDDEDIGNLDNLESSEEYSDEYERLPAEIEEPLISRTYDKTEFKFVKIKLGKSENEISKNAVVNRAGEQLWSNIAEHSTQKRGNRVKRYSTYEWSCVQNHKPNRNEDKSECELKLIKTERKSLTLMNIFEDELLRHRKNKKELLRRAKLSHCYNALNMLISNVPNDRKLTRLHTLNNSRNCIKKLQIRENFLIQTRQNLLKRNEQLNSKLLELMDK